jgi:WD40 repeat protein
MRRFQTGTGPVTGLQFTPDGASLVCLEGHKGERWSGTHRAVHWIELKTGTVTRSLDLNEDAWRKSISYAAEVAETGRAFVSPDGLWVVVKRYIGDPIFLDLWNGRTGKWREVPFESEYHFVVDAATFTPDSEILVYASGTDGGGTKAFERKRLKSGRRLPTIQGPGYGTQEMQISPDERRLAVLNYTGAMVYPHSRGAVDAKQAVELELEDQPDTLCFRPDGNELAILFGDELIFWDCLSPTPTTVKPVPEVLLTDLSYSPDGRSVVLACGDGSVRLWDCAANQVAQAFDWKIGPAVYSVCFAPDGMTCAVGGADGQVVLWDVED